MSDNKIEGIIYMIDCFDKEIKGHYIGSTLQTFNQRRREHKSNTHNEKSDQYNKKLYFHIRQNGGWLNWKMDIIERVLVDDVDELRQYEQLWIDTLHPDLNICRSYRTKEQNRKEKTALQRIYNAHSPVINCDNCNKKIKKCKISNHKKTAYCKNYEKK
jgi:hypothetical protein